MRWRTLRSLVGAACGVSGLYACGSFSTPPSESADAATEAATPVPSVSSSSEAGAPDASPLVDAAADGPPRVFRVFVTSDTTSGKFANGVDGADALCATSAAKALPNRRWKAYLALPNAPPRTRIAQVPGGWFDTLGLLVVDSPTRLDAPLDNPPKLDPDGKAVTGRAWTGMRAGVPRMTCDSWMGSGMGEIGDVGDKTSWFASGSDNGCASGNHLYCFEQP